MTHDKVDAGTVNSADQAYAIEHRTRLFDRDGVRWCVREAEYPMFDRRMGRFLVFESDFLMRRLRNYPPNWFDWSDDDLHGLSEARVT
jgi:hypothetical protein